MMKNKHVLSGIPVILLAFALVFTACENGTTEVEGAVDISSQEAPVVTANAVKGGVLLEWNPIIGAGYSVWRKAGNAEAIQLDSNYYLYQDKETGKYRYLDLVSDANALTENTEYTYTVVATGSYKTIGKTEVKAAPTNIPAKGAKLDPVSGVTLTLSPDTETITVSWTAAALPSAPTQYSVSVYRVGSTPAVGTKTIYLGEKSSASISWNSSSQTEGEYVAEVKATPIGSSSPSYFKESDPALSAGQNYEALFASSSSPSINGSSPSKIVNTETKTLTGFSVSINFNGSAKRDVAYAVERALLDTNGNNVTYTEVTLYKESSCTTALTPTDLTADPLGNLLYTTVYDKLPTTAGKYKYRVKATKQGVTTQTKEITNYNLPVTVDPRDEAADSVSISIGEGTEDTEAHTKTYAVTPTLSYKNALQTDDKLVIYYAKGDSNVSTTGPYAVGVEFTKDQLEATTVEARDLVIPKTDSDTSASVYVKAYLVFADGSNKASESVTAKIVKEQGVSDTNGGNYATLDY